MIIVSKFSLTVVSHWPRRSGQAILADSSYCTLRWIRQNDVRTTCFHRGGTIHIQRHLNPSGQMVCSYMLMLRHLVSTGVIYLTKVLNLSLTALHILDVWYGSPTAETCQPRGVLSPDNSLFPSRENSRGLLTPDHHTPSESSRTPAR